MIIGSIDIQNKSGTTFKLFEVQSAASGPDGNAIRAFAERPSFFQISKDKIPPPHFSWIAADKQGSLTCRYAMRFGEAKNVEQDETAHPDKVRAAFNSPFRPFILASTSVGQEGLDFHAYCHAIVHWNLPSNPVDLEQREGRIHRYKGHVIRKNIAAAYGLKGLEGEGDPWANLFSLAAKDHAEESDDLKPYWVFAGPRGSIERHMPMFALSREQERACALVKSVARYRLVFGQPRQEELLRLLAEQYSDEEMKEFSDLLQIDLKPA